MSAPKGLPPLSQDLIRIAAKGRVAIAVNAISRLNAQHERLTGGPAPGDAIRTYRGHDHCQDGGAVLCRGTLFSFDHGKIGNGIYVYHTLSSSSVWEGITPITRPYMFRVFPTPGLTGSLKCILVTRPIAGTPEIRLSNLTTGTQSSAVTVGTPTALWKGSITDVPFVAGRENQFDLEVRGNAADSVDIYGMCVYEDTSTHPATSGTTTYSSL